LKSEAESRKRGQTQEEQESTRTPEGWN